MQMLIVKLWMIAFLRKLLCQRLMAHNLNLIKLMSSQVDKYILCKFL